MKPVSSLPVGVGLALLLATLAPIAGVKAEMLVLPLIPRGAVWRYLDNGSNQGTNWLGLNVNDATWSAGPARLGYGGDSEVTLLSYGSNSSAKHITTYFRHAFEVGDASLFRALKLRLVRDDGAVVYLNGVEIFRSNLPAGSLNSSTLASVALGGGDEFIAVETNLPPTGLRNGTNVLAVELHQQSGGSSDLGFDLALDAEYANASPALVLGATKVNSQFLLSWPRVSVGHVLQSATRLGASSQWRRVTNLITTAGTNNRVALNPTGSNQFFRLRHGPVDATTLSNKLMFGYQGWFASTNDGSPPNRWVHWFRNGAAYPTNATIDFWPDTSELEADELFTTGLTMSNGTPAKVYAAYKSKTVQRHFQWMHDYGIDGIFLQRFTSELGDRSFADWRHQVAYNCRNGAETYGRVFAVMYDISGQNASTLVTTLINDWTYLTATMRLTNSACYLRHKGKPVVAIWGLGFTDRPSTASEATQIIAWFKAAGCTVMGGVPTNWRNLTGDAKPEPAWAAVYRSFDILSPWSVGRYGSVSGADSFRQNYLVPDLAETRAHGLDYLPVIFPGFSWHNLNAGPLNQIPRSGGRFWWRQLYNCLNTGCTMVYGAMFDEMDEGTAMLKMAPTPAQLPAQGTFVPLNVDGENLPSDWYLRLAGEGGKMLRREIPLSPTRPINP
jgi:hypothetical protein